jgi:hypothetical protein
MNRNFVKALVMVCVILLGYFGISLLSNISSLALFADIAVPGAGRFVFWSLTTLFIGLLATPIVIYLRMPKALIPPRNGTEAELIAYRETVTDHLTKNPLLTGLSMDTEEQLVAALQVLGRAADKIIKDTSSAVFISTAVMQNGRLDGLIVLASQMRMVWRIAKVYNLRPSPRQMLYLYSNVGANILIVDSIQGIEFAEITTPVVVSILPSLKGGLPGLQGISSLLVNSMANGAANAFLTLRIGLLARAYSEPLHRPEEAALRRSVTTAALSMVATIVKEQGASIVKKSWEGVRAAMVDAAEATIDGTKAAVVSAVDKTVQGTRTLGGRLGDAWKNIKGSAAE